MSKSLTHNRAVDQQTEARILAMVARGDSYTSIREALRREDISISEGAISGIKKRNPEALAQMKSMLFDQQFTQASSILNKSRTLLNRRLSGALKVEQDLANLHEDYNDGKIDKEEYHLKFEQLIRTELSVGDLNAISKESFNQSQVEAGKPTSIVDSPAQAKANLEILLQAIAKNDTKGMLEAVFPDAKPNSI